MKHRLYIAAPAEYADRCRILAEIIVAELGDAEVVSRWHDRPCTKYPENDVERSAAVALNVHGLERATVAVVLCDGGTPRSTLADAGYALGRGVPAVWVRGRLPSQQCIFDAHALVTVLETAPTIELAKDIARAIERLAGREVA